MYFVFLVGNELETTLKSQTQLGLTCPCYSWNVKPPLYMSIMDWQNLIRLIKLKNAYCYLPPKGGGKEGGNQMPK